MAKVIIIGNRKLVIEHDDSAQSPRLDDNIGTIAYKSRDYELGEEKIDDPLEWLANKLNKDLDELEYTKETMAILLAEFKQNNIILPVYIYEHSGITISTSPFNDRWDSGQLGWIYASHEKVVEEYGDLSEESIKQATEYLKNEIEILDQYCTGSVYKFTLYNLVECEHCKHVDEVEVDSCGGFYGYDHVESGLMDHAGFNDDAEREAFTNELD